MASPAENIEKFNRQRRNLTLAWAALFFYQTTVPTLERVALGSASFTLILGRPEFVPLWLSGIFLYFLIRYYQYFNALQPLATERQPIGYQFGLAENSARQALRKRILEQDLSLKTAPFDFSLDNESDSSKNLWQFSCSKIVVRAGGKAEARDIRTVRHSIIGARLAYFKIMGLLVASWNVPYFTEYWLPFVLPYICIAWGICENYNVLWGWIHSLSG